MQTIGEFIDNNGQPDNGKSGIENGSIGNEKIAGFASGSLTEDSDVGSWIDAEPVTESAGTGSASTNATTGGRKRGRPIGSKNKNQAQVSPDIETVNQKNLASLIMTAHVALAGLVQIPELGMMTESQAQEYADNVAEVAKYHIHHIDPQAIATFNLIAFQCGFYGMAFKQYRARVKSQRPVSGMPKSAAPAPNGTPGKMVFVVPPGASGNFEP